MLKILKLKVLELLLKMPNLFMRADGDIKNQTYVGVLAKL